MTHLSVFVYKTHEMTATDAIFDLESLRAAVRAGRSFRYRHFWGHRARPDGRLTDSVFSQFWPCDFTIDGTRYVFAEQWMMSGKARLFGDEEALAKILVATAPQECKRLGRTVRGFDDRAWAAHRFDLVTRGNVAKFGQDPALREYLCGTGEDILVEASPMDRNWGIGMAATHPDANDPLKWRGRNLLGFALVRTRAILRGEAAAP